MGKMVSSVLAVETNGIGIELLAGEADLLGGTLVGLELASPGVVLVVVDDGLAGVGVALGRPDLVLVGVDHGVGEVLHRVFAYAINGSVPLDQSLQGSVRNVFFENRDDSVPRVFLASGGVVLPDALDGGVVGEVVRGCPAREIDPWTYDRVGNASSLKDGKAQVTYYQHDAVNLQNRIDYPDGAKHYFEYDLARQTIAMADPTGRTTMGYDNLTRMTFRGNPESQNLYHEYDGVGNRTSLKDPDGVTVYFLFDAADRMQEVSSASYSGWISYYEYDLADEMVHERRVNGAVTYHGYDAAGRVSLIQHRKSDGTLIERYDYTRDEVGNILEQLRGSDSTSVYWNYDPVSSR